MTSPSDLPEQGDPHHFWIYPDWRGQYRWQLTTASGNVLARSRWGFAAYAGAQSDAEHERKRRGLGDEVKIEGTFR